MSSAKMAAMIPMTPITPLEGDVEMFTRGKMEPLFAIDTALANRTSMLSVVPEVDTPGTLLEVPKDDFIVDKRRPMSEITEIFDELDDIEDELSEFEEDSEEDFGFQSNEGRRSQSTISTYDEVPTPRSLRRLTFTHNEARRSVEGPRGPHLFRASNASELSFDFALQLSPVVNKKQELRIDTAFRESFHETTPTTIANVPATFATTEDQWNKEEPGTWSTDQVSLWMYQSGLESAVIEKFEDNDITGRVLLDLQFDDLKDIGIESFGKRHELWSQICSLRDGEGGISPVPTPFQDTSPRRSQGSRCSHRRSDGTCEDANSPTGPGGARRRRKYRANPNDPITPMDSVSIVAVEQLVPRPHKCSKGENCSKWKKQQKLFKRLNEDHGFPISPENGGHIWMSGDPGNALTAPNLVENTYRPVSEAIPSVVGPSVVASSDLLGPGDMPTIALQADLLKQLQERDAQENVKNFLSLQHVEPPQVFEPASPLPAFGDKEPLEMFPSTHLQPGFAVPLTGLQSLPRLQIPRSSTTVPVYENNGNLSNIQDPFSAMSPCHTALATPGGMYRFGTPASEMDVAAISMPIGPIARDSSQSVPPNMVYRDPVRNSRQEWRRPSCALPSLNENEVFSPGAHSDTISRRASDQTFGSNDMSALKREVKLTSSDPKKKLDPRYPGVAHAGWMKKRKTKLLRHEWNEHHFRLTGNELKMHQNDIPQSAILESLNIDEYAVACSSIASNKLAAKFKALKIAKDKEKEALKHSTFEFQLVPDQMSRQSKSHHFAVKSRDERIDWMRELMLAKALRAKKEGLVVEVNGKEV